MKVEHPFVRDVLALQRRTVAVRADAQYREIGVRSFARGLFVKPLISGADLGSKRVFHVEPGDLVVSNIFAWEGAVAVATEAHRETIGSHRFMTWAPRPGVHVPFLAHYFASDRGLDQLRRASPGSAGRNRTLSIQNFEAIQIPLPSFSDQHRIAAHLDSVSRASELSLLSARECDDGLRSIVRREWPGTPTRIGALVTPVSRPIQVHDGTGYKMAGVRWYGGGLFHRETTWGSTMSANTVFEVRTGDLVYNRLFAWKQSFAIAERSDMTVSNEFPTFSIRTDRILPGALLALLLSDNFTTQVNKASTGSTPTSRNRLQVERFLSLAVPLPSRECQTTLCKTTSAARKAEALSERAVIISDALLPAARNEVFNALR